MKRDCIIPTLAIRIAASGIVFVALLLLASCATTHRETGGRQAPFLSLSERISRLHYSDSQIASLEKQAARIDKLFNVDARSSVQIYFDLAKAYLSRDELEPALTALEEGLQLDPENGDMQILYAQVLIRVGREEDAYSRLSYLAESGQTSRVRGYAAHIISSNHLSPPSSMPSRPELHGFVLYLAMLGPMPDFVVNNIKSNIEQQFRFPVVVIDRRMVLPTQDMRQNWSHFLASFISRMTSQNSRAKLGRFYTEIGIPQNGPATDAQREQVLKAIIAQDPKAPRDEYTLLRYRYANQYDANTIFLALRREFAAQLGQPKSLGLLAVTRYDIFAGRSNYLFALSTRGLSVMSVHRFILPGTSRELAIRRSVTQAFSSVVQILGVSRADHLPCASAYPNSLAEMDQKRAYLCPSTLKELAAKYRQLETAVQGNQTAQ